MHTDKSIFSEHQLCFQKFTKLFSHSSHDQSHKPQLCKWLQGGRFWLQSLMLWPPGRLTMGADDLAECLDGQQVRASLQT